MSVFKRFLRGLLKRTVDTSRARKDGKREGGAGADLAQRDSTVAASVDENERRIRQDFGNSSDLTIRRMEIGGARPVGILIAHIDGLVDNELMSETVIRPISLMDSENVGPAQVYAALRTHAIQLSGLREVTSWKQVVLSVSVGDCVILVDGVKRALAARVQGWEQRGIEEPTTETTIRGPKEAFIEGIRTNTALLRRRIHDPRLRVEERKIGRVSETSVAVAYIDGIADPRIVQEVRNRLDQIDIDAIQESGEIEELVEDAPHSIFPTMLRTERPDRVAGSLLEGRVAILTDGTPFVLIVPVTFTMYLTSPEDYYERYFIATALRMLRLLAIIFALLLPATYVAITTYHQEMLPTPLILSIAAQREGIPFPAFVEALIMDIMFEMVREAGVRLPRVIGPAVSIVGVLALGDAAIRAGLVSPIMVIVVAATGISSFTIPSFSMAVSNRILRFVFLALGASLGLFGIAAGLFALLLHLSSLQSFGVFYLEPIAPVISSDLKDTAVRVPWWMMYSRPSSVRKGAFRRMRVGVRPEPHEPHADGGDELS